MVFCDKVLRLILIVTVMSRVCDKCGRGTVTSAKRSKSNIQTKKQSFINLQIKTIGGVRKKLCTKCIKTMTKA